jgi:hypothetical protein
MHKLLISAIFLIILTAPVFSWDDVGHKISAYIAWQRMSPTARENVIKILRAAPEDSQLATFYVSYGAEPEETRKREYFMLVATWADIIRDRAFDTRYKNYHKSNWHYADTFWKQVNGKVERLSGFEEGGQAVVKLTEFDKLIHDASAGNKDKAIAIAWIMHLIGDLHQPLHTSARVTDLEPKGDQGGNLFLLTPQGTPREKQENLHWFWDSIVVRNVPLKGEMCERDYLEPLAQKFMKKYPFSAEQAHLNLSNYEALQQETFAFNATDVFSPDLVRFQTPSEKYKKNAFSVAEKQLAMAGYRMGELFNAVFGAPAPTTAASCQVIRKIMYPVFKKQTPENRAKAKPTAVLLDVCPTGPAARPTIMIAANGKTEARAFDVMKAFSNDNEARTYAATNSIKDVSFEIQ